MTTRHSSLADGIVSGGLIGLNRFEAILLNAGFEAHANASHATRNSVTAATRHLKAIRDVGAGVAGPLLYSYVRWVAADAYARGIRRLYFVARDGEVLCSVARACPDIRDSFDLRMLYGSRQSWYLAGMDVSHPERESWLTEHAEKLTARLFLQRLGLTIADVQGLEDVHHVLGTSGVQRVTKLITEPEIRSAIEQRVDARRQVIRQYMRQEEVSRGRLCALVDLGWTGRMYAALNAVFSEMSEKMPPVYMFGLFRAVPIDFDCYAWLFDTGVLADVPIRRIGGALETFCLSDSGHTVGYEPHGAGRVKPTRKYDSRDHAIKWGLPTLRQAIGRFAAEAGTAPPVDRNTAVSLLAQFWYQPELTEAKTWGDAPYEDDQQAELETRLAHPTSWPQAFRHLRQRTLPWAGQCWPAGAKSRTSRPVRGILELAVKSGWIDSLLGYR